MVLSGRQLLSWVGGPWGLCCCGMVSGWMMDPTTWDGTKLHIITVSTLDFNIDSPACNACNPSWVFTTVCNNHVHVIELAYPISWTSPATEARLRHFLLQHYAPKLDMWSVFRFSAFCMWWRFHGFGPFTLLDFEASGTPGPSHYITLQDKLRF